MTLQRVMTQLQDEGFIWANGRAGTFVSERLPHLSRYALLIPFSRTQVRSRFWDALARQARALNGADTRHSLSVYYNIWPEHRDRDEYDELIAQVKSHRVAGLIFAASPWRLRRTPLLDQPDMPWAIIGGGDNAFGVPEVGLDGQGWTKRACERLRQRGRRRVAFLYRNGEEKIGRTFQRQAEIHGLDVPPQWMFALSERSAAGVRSVTHLLMTLPRDERPDALVIQDDHLVEPATRGVTASGVRVPDDLEIIAHVNYPEPPPTSEPVTWLGYDSRESISRSVDLIDRQRKGLNVPDRIEITPLFDDEVAAQWGTLGEKVDSQARRSPAPQPPSSLGWAVNDQPATTVT